MSRLTSGQNITMIVRPQDGFRSYHADQHQYLSYWIEQRQKMRSLTMRFSEIKVAAEHTKSRMAAIDWWLGELQQAQYPIEYSAMESARAASEKSQLQNDLQDLKFQAREIKIEARKQQLMADRGQLDNIWHDHDLSEAVDLENTVPSLHVLPAPTRPVSSMQLSPPARPTSNAGIYATLRGHQHVQPHLPPRPHTVMGRWHDSMDPLIPHVS